MGDGFTVTLGGLDLTAVDAGGASWRTTDVTGWSGSPAATLSPVQKTRAPGAWSSPSEYTARTVSLAGLVEAADATALRVAVDRLNAAVPLGGASLAVTEGSLTRTLTVRHQDEVLTSVLTDTVAQWSVQMVALDPRKRGSSGSTSTALPSTTGGLTVPFTVPFTITAVTVTGTCSLTNPGNAVGPVVLRIDGPIVGPQVTHVSTGLALVFASDLAIAAGDWLEVDMEAQTALANGQSPRNGDVTRREWSGFDPGVNQWAFAATSGSGTLTVTGTPTWL